jgi:hypothetical protein
MDSPDPKGDSPAYEKAGYVYAFGDNELSLIKFGRTTDLKARKAYIERVCGFVKGISLVAAVKVKACKRLEDIIHQDLAPHRWFFDCGCGQFKRQKGFTRHQEWFQIDNHTASSTLQLWADFGIASCRTDEAPISSANGMTRCLHLRELSHPSHTNLTTTGSSVGENFLIFPLLKSNWKFKSKEGYTHHASPCEAQSKTATTLQVTPSPTNQTTRHRSLQSLRPKTQPKQTSLQSRIFPSPNL